MDGDTLQIEPVGLAHKFLSPSIVSILGVVLLVIYLYREAYRTNFPKLASIPEVPGGLPFVGHLPQLGGRLKVNDADIYLPQCRTTFGKPMWPEYYRLMEPNLAGLIMSLYEDGKNGKKRMDLYPLLRQNSVDLTLSLTYGVRVGEFDEEFTNGLLDSIAEISSIRSSTVFYKHFVPLLRIFPEKTSRTMKAVEQRTKRINILYETYLSKVEKGEANLKCIVSSLGNDKLTLDEIHCTCVSLLQAAPDTVASATYQCCAWLCSPEGQPFQKEAVDAILAAYNGDRDEAWKMAFREEKVPLIVSLYKETLRFWPTAPFGSRATSKEINLNGIIIPKGMGVLMDHRGVNHDLYHYGADACSFNPRRFVDNETPLPHLAYGTGGRICPAYQISNRIMSANLTRLLLSFQDEASRRNSSAKYLQG
ncbi:cytochrome P450 [Stipitochalara longipes BDJ]|nr:cytochrome P450 [Stipitochalara longipes BDJ]